MSGIAKDVVLLGDRRSDLSYALGGWSGRIERRTGKYVDGNRDQWNPDIVAIKAVCGHNEYEGPTGILESRGYWNV